MGRRSVFVFAVFSGALLVCEGTIWLLLQRGLCTVGQAWLAAATMTLALALMAIGWMRQVVHDQHHKLKHSEASLQSQVTAREKDLESLNANLRIATKVNALLALSAQHMPNAVIITDPAGAVLWANAAWEKLSGFSPSASIRRPLPEVLRQVWNSFDPQAARDILRSGSVATLEARAARPGSPARWLSFAFQPVRNDRNEVVNTIVLVDDFTARHDADLKIQAANERLQFALRSSGFGIWETFLDDGRLEWDDRMCELYGVNRAEFGGMIEDWMTLIHPDDVEGLRAHRQQVIEGKLKAFGMDYRIVRPDGNVRHIEGHGVLHRDSNGVPQRFVGLNRDITADKEMRETLRVAEERLELALLATNESVWDWNIPARQIYRDQRWAELRGLTSGPVVEDDAKWTTHVHPDDLPSAQGALDAHLQGRTPVYISEHRLQGRNGQWFWTLDRGKVVSRDKDGRPLRMVGTQGNITSRKQMEERLRHSEEISIQVSRLAQIGAWEYTVASKQLRWEPELFRISEVELGYEPSFLGMSKFIPGEAGEMFDQALELALNEGRSFDLECPFVTAQGRRRWVRVFGRTEFADGLPVRIFGAVQEITGRHEAEEAQRKMEGQLFQVQKMETLGTLAGGIAHDFNNLLTGIIGYQDLSLDNLAEDHPSRPCLTEAHKACMRACELVEQILVFSRQTGGSERAAVDLGIIVEETRRFLRATVPATVKIEVTVAANCGRVQADPSQLSQVLLNLGSNAAHAMRSGNGILGIAVTPVTMNATQAASHGNLPAGQYVRLNVSDTGHGMNAETQKRIFDPFFTTKNVGEGTGLGLAIVHGIVRAHGGAIDVQSTPGRGTIFQIYLPAAVAEWTAPEPSAEPPPRGNGEIICIVDDEQLVLQATRLTLERFGYKTVAFNSPTECLKALQQEPDGCDVLLSDQTMPGLTGLELSAAVREFSPQLPIIIMSGYFSKVSTGALEQIGNIALLAKPFVARDVLQAVAAAAASRPA